MSSSGASTFRDHYEISPIVLVGGIAANAQEGKIPILQLLSSGAFSDGLQPSGLSSLFGLGGDISALLGTTADEYFAHFRPIPGGSIIQNDIGRYPFANQATAANANIAQPLRISMVMDCPARGSGGWSSKSAIMQSLQASLAQHSAQGGWYVVVTPSYQYDSCLLIALTDVSSGLSKQPQYSWQWDFEQPLITQAQASQAYNTLLSKIDSGTRVIPNQDGSVSWSGINNTQGSPPTGSTTPLSPGVQGGAASFRALGSANSFSLAAP